MEHREFGFPGPSSTPLSVHVEEGTDDLNLLAMDQKKVITQYDHRVVYIYIEYRGN